MTIDIDNAAERVRNLTATDAAFANFMADSSFDSAEEMLRFIEWFDEPGRVPSGWDLTRYARAKMALSYAAQAAELSTAKAEAASLRAQHAELNAELLDLARRYDPNCDMYVYEDQANAMDAARQTVEAMQELAEFLGRDPEGCLVDCADEAAGRIERAEDEIAELRAKLAAAEKERDHANLFTQVVLSSLHWTGDGYEWTGGRYDYRMSPSEAAALTTSEIERLRSEAKEHKAERDTLMTALDGLLNDFIKAVPSSEPIDCHKFTRYQPALLAYVTVRDRKPLAALKPGGA